MSFLDSVKRYVGLDSDPHAYYGDDAYYGDEPRYESNGSAAYQPHRHEDYDEHYRGQSHREANSRPRQRDIVAISLTSYSDAQKLGEPFRNGDVVVFELTDADRDVAKRFIDFAAGLCFALRGRMIKLTKNMKTDRMVFAILPENTDAPIFELEEKANLR